jgi:putative peptide zinc metalloprotease protein
MAGLVMGTPPGGHTAQQQAPPLAPLRQDLALHAGAAAADGSPTWTLHDPAANRFYQLSWPAFELLSRWTLGSLQAVADTVNRETTLRVTLDDAQALQHMLERCHLLQARSAQDTRRLAAGAAAGRLGAAQWLLHNYLFFRVPLVRPAAFLNAAARYVGWAFHPAFWAAVAMLALLGLLLALRRWDEFMHGFASYAGVGGVIAIACAMSASKVLHELGHAFAAHRYGCRVPSMGLAFLVLWPVLYTDTNEAWKLASRRQRLVIGAAGMASEIALAALATVLWSLLPDTPQWAPLRSGAFVLASTAWVLTLAVNASPFMRFDGYFLLSDALNLPNLHERAFAQGRWWLRERLFGFGDAMPEPGPPAHSRFLVAFAFGTWLYRLVLFLGIALLVYHLFFKALGVLLMAVELGWFIARPVWRELKVWWQRRADLRWNRRTAASALLAAGAAFVLLWPWQVTVHAPAVLGAATAQGLYAPYAAQVVTPLPAPGTRVKAGDLLVSLRSPDLQARLDLAQAREQQLQWQLVQQPFNAQLMEAGPALRKRWEAAVQEVSGLQQEAQRLQMNAPFDGVVAQAADDAMPQAWIPAGLKLLVLVSPTGTKVEAFVDETELADARDATQMRFIGSDVSGSAVACTELAADAVQLVQLDQPLVASVNGGAVAVQRAADGRLLPLRPVFRVVLDGCDGAESPALELVGVAALQGPRRPLAVAALRWAGALWRREGGVY